MLQGVMCVCVWGGGACKLGVACPSGSPCAVTVCSDRPFLVHAGLYPRLEEARSHIVTVVQHPGDAIFVPSGWWHTGRPNAMFFAPANPQQRGLR